VDSYTKSILDACCIRNRTANTKAIAITKVDEDTFDVSSQHTVRRLRRRLNGWDIVFDVSARRGDDGDDKFVSIVRSQCVYSDGKITAAGKMFAEYWEYLNETHMDEIGLRRDGNRKQLIDLGGSRRLSA